MKHCLKTATEPALALLKEEVVLDGTKAVKSSHLSSEAVTGEAALLFAKKTVCFVYKEEFWNQRKTNEV